MRRRVKTVLLAALAALASFAAAQVQNEEGADSLLSSTGRTVLSIPATTPGPLIEDTPNTVLHWSADRWNPLQFSNDLTNAIWTVYGGTVAGGQQDPFGGTAATAVVENGTYNPHGLSQTANAGTGTYTLSAYLKPGARNYGYLQMDSGAYCFFTLIADGSVGTCGNSGVGTITRSANGFYRVAVTGTASGSILWFVTAANNSSSAIYYTGTAGVTGVTVYGPEVTRGLTPAPYWSEGAVFAMQGAVPLVTTSTLFPTGSGAGRRLVGPFTAANYLRWQTATPVQFAGDHTICVAYVRNTGSTSTNFLHTLDAGATTGWYFQEGVGTVSYHEISSSVDKSAAVTATTTPSALNVLCGGRSGTTIFAKLNGGTTAATTGAAAPLSYPTDMYIGEWNGGVALSGYVYEVWATTTAWSEGNVANIEAAALANGGKGAIFPDDAGTVLHLVGNAYDGSTWKSPQATLTTTGAVPYSDAWAPPVAGQLQRQAYGPFSDAAYFGLGSGSDVLDFTGDFTMCAVVGAPGALGVGGTGIASDGVYQTSGWEFGISATGAAILALNWGGAAITATTTNVATTGPNVACWGRSGTSALVKMNLGTTVTQAGSTIVAATGTTAKIGRYAGAGQPFLGPIYEVWASTATPTDALFTAIQRRVFQHLSAHGAPITTTRTSGVTYELPSSAASTQTIFMAPGNITAAQPDGSEVWRASTNLTLNSAGFDQGNWVKTGTAGQEASILAANSAVAPDGTQTADTVYLATVTVAQTSHVYSTVNGNTALPVIPHTSVVWLKGVSASDTVYLRAWVSATGATIAFTPCAYTASAWTKCTLTWTPHAASTESIIAIGQVGSENGAQNAKTFYAWGAQTEAQPYATPYIPTAGTTAARNASAISIPNPLPANSASWCLRFTARPGVSRTWADGETHTFLSSGADGSANSFSVVQDPAGSLIFTVYDSAGAVKWFSTPGFTDSSPHDVAICLRQGAPYVYVDGLRSTGLSGGLGAGIIAAPQSTIYLGSSNGTTNFLDGVIRDVQFCDGPTGACTQNTSPSASNATTYYPWAQSGSFVTDANTIANVTFSGSAIVDPYNVTTPWTMVGSVGQNQSSPFYTSGFNGAQVKGAGPFAAAAYYKLVGGGALGFPGGVGSMCWAYNKYTGYGAAAAVALGATGEYAISGWQMTDDASFWINGAGVARAVSAVPGPTVFGLNVVCAGLNNNVPYIKVNGGAFTAGVALAGPYVPPTGDATLGWYAANKFLNGSLLAFWASTTAPSDALFKKQIQSFLGSMGATASEVLTTTRTTAATGLTPDGSAVFTWPPGTPRVACDGTAGKCGLQVEPARTNNGLYSDGGWMSGTVPSGWTFCGVACTNNVGFDPAGTNSAVRFVLPSPGEVFNNVSIGTDINNRTFTGSIFCRSVSGTAGAVYIGMTDTASWAAGRAGQTRCALPAGGNYTRCTNTLTYTASAGAVAIGFVIGTANHGYVGIDAPAITVDCWGYQVEEGAYATSYISAQGTATARNADAITATNPLAASNPADWCVDAVYTPESGRAWGTAAAGTRLFSTYPPLAKSMLLTETDGASDPKWDTYSDASVDRRCALANFAAGAHRISTSATARVPSGVLVDGAPATCTMSGAGTGATTHNATLAIGGQTDGSGAFPGFIRHFRVCNSSCQTCR